MRTIIQVTGDGRDEGLTGMGRIRRSPRKCIVMGVTLALLITAAVAAEAPAADKPVSGSPPFKHYVGHHGPDGTQIYPNCNPPIEWDGKTGKNILWQTPMPNVGDGQPVVVDGRVFVMSEAGYESAFPELLCLDANTGKILWKRQINHLGIEIADPAKRAEVEQAWTRHVFLRREEQVLKAALRTAKDDSTKQDLEKKIQDLRSDQAQNRTMEKEFGKYALGFYIPPGLAFPTPCSDGRNIYVFTGWGQCASFDFDGNLRWIRRYQGGGWGGIYRSPVLWRDLFIVDQTLKVYALAKDTGELQWIVDRRALFGGHNGDTHTCPKIFRVGDEELLWCEGGYYADAFSANKPIVIRLRDGVPIRVDGWKNPGLMVAPNTDEPGIMYVTGGGGHSAYEDDGYMCNPPPAGVRLAWDGDILKASVLWSGLPGRLRFIGPDQDCPCIAYANGRVYYTSQGRAWVMLDGQSGKVLQGMDATPQNRPVPNSRYVYAIANERIYGAPASRNYNSKDLEMEVFDLEGKKLACNTIPGPVFEGAIQRMAAVNNYQGVVYTRFSYAYPFTIGGDRIYFRGLYHLYCIGEK